MHDNEKNEENDEHCEHQREEQALHEAHVREEEMLDEANERVEAELHRAEEEQHQRHVREEEELHTAHEREEQESHTDLVKININDVTVEVQRGIYSVAAIKTLGNVAQGYNLLKEVDGKLMLEADDASVTIKGCEVFVSRVKSGASS